MIRHTLNSAAATCILLVATACATTPPPPPPEASLSFSKADGCTETFTAENAEPLTVGRRKSSGSATSILDADSACQTIGTTQSPYALFKLPSGVKISSIQAGGVFQSKRVFAGEVVTLDQNLAPIRTFGPEAFLHRGSSLSVFFQTRENERYVAIRANPDLIGKQHSFTLPVEDAASTEAPTAGRHVGYSYDGPVFARVFLSEPASVGPKDQ